MSERVIDVRELRREFGSFVAVRDVSFDVQSGEIFGYLGANGAGKSTTIRMLCGLLPPSGGSATVAGHDVQAAPEAVKRSIGYMSQKFSLYRDLTVAENMEFFGGMYGLLGRSFRRARSRVVELMELSPHLRRITGQLPGGIRQRVALACAVLHEPRLVFLDEPTAGVDPESRRDFWTLIRGEAEAGTTMFVTTHYMDEAEYCARIGLMVAGRLVALDTPLALCRDLVPGRILALSGDGLGRATAALRDLPGVLAVDPYGRALHVRFEPERLDDDAIVTCASEHGAQVRGLAPVTANLEDVFLAVVREHEQGKQGTAA